MFSFSPRKRRVDIESCMRRICDRTTPNYPLPVSNQHRQEQRYNRTIPVLLGPWRDHRVALDECTWGVTKDICDRGVGVVLNQPFRAESAVIGFWLPPDIMSEPWFFLGETQGLGQIGGGFWLLGIELVELANHHHQDKFEALRPLAAQLLPDVASARQSESLPELSLGHSLA